MGQFPSVKVSKKKKEKFKFKSNQQKVVKFMKRKSLRKYQESYYPSPRSERIESFGTNGH